MIFQKEHIDMILKGVKTQTRRIHKGKYQEGRSYSIQPCRICKGIETHRIVMDEIHEEKRISHGIPTPTRYFDYYIRAEDAWAEGGYTVEEFETLFRKLNPKGNYQSRWVFKFHAKEVRK